MTQISEKKKTYPSEVSKNGWKTLSPHLPTPKSNAISGGRPAVDLRDVINAILYVLRNGNSWRHLLHDFPQWQTGTLILGKKRPFSFFLVLGRNFEKKHPKMT